METAFKAYEMANTLKNVDIKGIDCHIGSQISEAKPFEDALQNIMAISYPQSSGRKGADRTSLFQS